MFGFCLLLLNHQQATRQTEGKGLAQMSFKIRSNNSYRHNNFDHKTGFSSMFKSAPLPFRLFALVVTSFIAVVFVGVIGLTAFNAVSAKSPEVVSCTVTSKERVTIVSDGDSSTQLLVNTDECGTLEIGSSLISGNWSPNKTYSSIVEGETYDFEVYGFELDFMNAYKQIKSVTLNGDKW